MKRDFDAIRAILLAVEERDSDSFAADLPLEGFSTEAVAYNARLLVEAGFLRGKVMELDQGPDLVHISGMMWKGHDFLDAARDETIWKKAKSTLLSKGASIGIDVLKAWLISEAKARFLLPPG